MTAKQILTAVEQAYARHQTYRDTGSVRTEFLYPGGDNFISTVQFKTAFVRPDRFRFEFSSHHPKSTDLHHYIIAARGADVQTWWDIRPGVEQAESLTMAIAGATGVSKGAALTVPALLTTGWTTLGGLVEGAVLTRLPDDEHDGAVFHRVARQQIREPMSLEEAEEITRTLGHTPPKDESVSEPDILWIDPATFLIRRIDGACAFPAFRTREVTLYAPVVNALVGEDALAFDPPDVGA